MRKLLLALSLVTVHFALFPVHANDNGQIIEIATAREMFERGVLFVDVRSIDDYRKGHIPGAIHVDVRKDSFETNFVDAVRKDQEVILYCSGDRCTRTPLAISKAISLGFEKLFNFKMGYPGWKYSGFPVEE